MSTHQPKKLSHSHYCWWLITKFCGWFDSLRLNVAYICESKLGHHWFKQWLNTCSLPSHYLNQCWIIVKWTLANKFQWNLSQNTTFFIQENLIENVVCKVASILSQPLCVCLDLCCNLPWFVNQNREIWPQQKFRHAKSLLPLSWHAQIFIIKTSTRQSWHETEICKNFYFDLSILYWHTSLCYVFFIPLAMIWGPFH